MAAGMIAIGSQGHNTYTAFEKERIFDRQRALIERVYRKAPKLKDRRHEELRAGMEKIEKAPRKERCIFDTDFYYVTAEKGDVEAAKKLMKQEKYDPYSHCETSNQVKTTATKELSIVGAILLFIGTCWNILLPRKKREESIQSLPISERDRQIDALVAIGKLDINNLIGALNTDDPDMREQAATALGRIGKPEALPILLKVMNEDPDEYVREYARRAVSEIERKNTKY